MHIRIRVLQFVLAVFMVSAQTESDFPSSSPTFGKKTTTLPPLPKGMGMGEGMGEGMGMGMGGGIGMGMGGGIGMGMGAGMGEGMGMGAGMGMVNGRGLRQSSI